MDGSDLGEGTNVEINLILDMAADSFGDRIALFNDDQRFSYTQLSDLANRIAAQLTHVDRLAFLGETSPEHVAALFGAARRGLSFAPLNYRLAQQKLERQLIRLGQAAFLSNIGHDLTLPEGLKRLELRTDATAPEISQTGENEVAIELFTSGTTGEPKIALLKHENLMAYILGTVEFMSAGVEEATLVSVPPYHIAGISAVLSSVYAGRKMVQLPNFEPSAWLELAAKEKVTHAFVVPTMLQRILDAAPELNLPDLRFLAYGGGRMPLPVIEKAMELLPHVQFTNAYGLTETSSTICLLSAEQHRAAFDSEDRGVKRRLSSVGQAIPGIELRICDENGEELRPEQAGLVYARGSQISGSYGETGSVLDKDGWFATKDRGYVDNEGFLFLDGRDDDVIVRGGENISPGEIEEILLKHHAISDVAAIAVPDEEWGETVGLAVVCDRDPPSEAEIRDLIQQQLRSSRLPKQIRFYDTLPYNETGKLLRRILRDDFAK